MEKCSHCYFTALKTFSINFIDTVFINDDQLFFASDCFGSLCFHLKNILYICEIFSLHCIIGPLPIKTLSAVKKIQNRKGFSVKGTKMKVISHSFIFRESFVCRLLPLFTFIFSNISVIFFQIYTSTIRLLSKCDHLAPRYLILMTIK